MQGKVYNADDLIYFNEHYIPDEYLILTFSFVEITNSSLSFVNISGKEKREQKQRHHMLRALLLCVLLLSNTDNLGFVISDS